MTRELAGEEIGAIVNATKTNDQQSVDMPGGDDAAAQRTGRSEQDSASRGRTKRMAAATSSALRLAKASDCPDGVRTAAAKTSAKNNCVRAPNREDGKADDIDEVRQCVATTNEHDWRPACAKWAGDLQNEKMHDGFVPSANQTEVLSAVRRRCAFEATGAGDPSEAPSLRLVHGLPGSGKPKVLEWPRTCSETV